MMTAGWYYLHVNGELIFKRLKPDPGDFVRRTWPVDLSDRGSAWRLLCEAAALGVRPDRLRDLCVKWGITPADLVEYFARDGATDPTPERYRGLRRICEEVWGYDPDVLLDHVAATPKGSAPDMSRFPWPREVSP